MEEIFHILGFYQFNENNSLKYIELGYLEK